MSMRRHAIFLNSIIPIYLAAQESTMCISILRNGILASTLTCVALAGCATASKDLTASYISPVQYQNYDCGQLSAESQRLQVRVTELGGRLDQAASNDKILMGVGLVLFWPAWFALGGTKQQEAEFSRLKGEFDAVDQAMIARKCNAQQNANLKS